MLLELGEDGIELHASPTMATLVKRIPNGRHDSKRNVWVFPRTWATCIMVRGVLGSAVEVGPKLAAWSWEEKARVDRVLAARDKALGTQRRPVSVTGGQA